MDLVKIQETHKKYFQIIQAVSGILIFILLLSMWFMVIEDKKLKTEISENCGWAAEDYECYCEKGEAIRLKNLMDKDLIINYTVEEAEVLEHDKGDYKYGWEE